MQKQTFAIDTYNPPLIRELQMLAVALGSKTEKLFVSRLVTVALGLVLLISVYLTTRKHFGAGIGLFALFFLAFEPNFLGHSHYVTLDIGTALFFFLASEIWVDFKLINLREFSSEVIKLFKLRYSPLAVVEKIIV